MIMIQLKELAAKLRLSVFLFIATYKCGCKIHFLNVLLLKTPRGYQRLEHDLFIISINRWYKSCLFCVYLKPVQPWCFICKCLIFKSAATELEQWLWWYIGQMIRLRINQIFHDSKQIVQVCCGFFTKSFWSKFRLYLSTKLLKYIKYYKYS